MVPPILKLPFLNIMTEVLLMQVPSGKISMGNFFLSAICSFSLLVTRCQSFISERSDQTCGQALTIALNNSHPPGMYLANRSIAPIHCQDKTSTGRYGCHTNASLLGSVLRVTIVSSTERARTQIRQWTSSLSRFLRLLSDNCPTRVLPVNQQTDPSESQGNSQRQ